MAIAVTGGLLLAGFSFLFRKKHISGPELERILKQNDANRQIEEMKHQVLMKGFLS